MYEDFTVGDKMLKEYTFFEWEEPLEPIENVVADILAVSYTHLTLPTN